MYFSPRKYIKTAVKLKQSMLLYVYVEYKVSLGVKENNH